MTKHSISLNSVNITKFTILDTIIEFNPADTTQLPDSKKH